MIKKTFAFGEQGKKSGVFIEAFWGFFHKQGPNRPKKKKKTTNKKKVYFYQEFVWPFFCNLCFAWPKKSLKVFYRSC